MTKTLLTTKQIFRLQIIYNITNHNPHGQEKWYTSPSNPRAGIVAMIHKLYIIKFPPQSTSHHTSKVSKSTTPITPILMINMYAPHKRILYQSVSNWVQIHTSLIRVIIFYLFAHTLNWRFFYFTDKSQSSTISVNESYGCKILLYKYFLNFNNSICIFWYFDMTYFLSYIYNFTNSYNIARSSDNLFL